MKRIFLIFIAFLLFGLSTNVALAKLGVGVGIGQIKVENKLFPGTIYKLPSFTVLNTGNEESDYEVSLSFNDKQNELKPKEEWFIFSPQRFHLKPAEIKMVDVKLNLPLRMEPGDYFAYLEARPVMDSKGGVSIGIAAAAKLYFTVVPANIFQGVYYKLLSFWKIYAPWPKRAAITLLIVVLLIIFKKFFNINLKVKKPTDKNSQTDQKDE